MSIVAEILEDVFAPRPLTLPVGFPVAHLSPSSIDSYWKCAEQWRREKIDRVIRPTTAEQLFGSAFHRAAEHNFNLKIASGEDLPVSEMRDVTGVSFSEVFEEEKGTNQIEWGDSKPNNVQAEVITAMVGTGSHLGFHQVLAPTIRPVEVERWILADTNTGVPLKGRIDIETADGKLVDLKTSKRAKTQADLDKSTQATAYLYGRARELNPAASFVWATAIRTVKPQQQELTTLRTSGELEAFDRLVEYTVTSILDNLARYGEEGPWPAASPLAWWCAPTTCSFYGSCFWRGGAK